MMAYTKLIEAGVTPKQLESIKQAADNVGLSLASFIRVTVLKETRKINSLKK